MMELKNSIGNFKSRLEQEERMDELYERCIKIIQPKDNN